MKVKKSRFIKPFIVLIVAILGIFSITISTSATSISGQYQYYDIDYEDKPTFIYSYGAVITDEYTKGIFKPYETLLPFYEDNSTLVEYPYFQQTYCNDNYYYEMLDVSLNTNFTSYTNFAIFYRGELNISASVGDLIQLNYYFNDFYYEQEDYYYIPKIYTTNVDKYYNVEYLVDAEYLNPTTHKMERRTFTQTLFATQEFYLIPNVIGYIYSLSPNETYPNTLFKIHYSQCYISLNQESSNSVLHYDNIFEYYCLDISTSEYYEEIDERFYQIKANNQNSVTETLGEKIGDLLDIEILPGLSFLGILGLALAIPLLVWILKLFFGG